MRILNSTQISHTNECDVNENNNLIQTTSSLNTQDQPTIYIDEARQMAIIHPMTLNTQSSQRMFDCFYQCLLQSNECEDTIDKINKETPTEPIKLEDQKEVKKQKANSFNWASFDSGATVLSFSDGIKSAKSIIINRKDKYMMMPCELQDKWFVIQLSEDIVIERIEITNFEHYSSNFKHVRIYAKMASNDHHDDDDDDDEDDEQNESKKQIWNLISDVQLENTAKNVIEFTEKSNGWRLLKVEILSYYGAEYYCTATQIKVFGSTMLAHWKNDVLSHLEEAEEIKQNITNNTNITIPRSISQRKQSPKQDGENKQLSVFSILTKRITSLELNLTKQQLQSAHLFGKIDELTSKFEDYQLNVTNHVLYQSYGISMMLKHLKDGGNMNQSSDEDETVKPNWSTQQTSYYQDLPSWQRQEQLERIEMYMQNMEVMMTYILWIGLTIIITQCIMAIALAVYMCQCCHCCEGRRHHHNSHKLKTNKHRISNAQNSKSAGSNKLFNFSRSLSQTFVGSKKRKNNKRKFKR